MRIVRNGNIEFSKLMSTVPCLAKRIDDLQMEIEQKIRGLQLTKPNATGTLREYLGETFFDYKKKVDVFPNVVKSGAAANYCIDYLSVIRECSCGAKHQIALELCFDNRQAIGTNLLKAHFANRLISQNEQNSSVSILMVAEDAIKAKAYDNSTGSESEYESALLSLYAPVLTSAICMLTLIE
jgi:hypothetical protein